MFTGRLQIMTSYKLAISSRMQNVFSAGFPTFAVDGASHWSHLEVSALASTCSLAMAASHIEPDSFTRAAACSQ